MLRKIRKNRKEEIQTKCISKFILIAIILGTCIAVFTLLLSTTASSQSTQEIEAGAGPEVIPPPTETTRLPISATTAEEYDYVSHIFTVADVIFFSYKDGTEAALFDSSGTPIWDNSGNPLNKGEHAHVIVEQGVYTACGSEKFAILTGDPITRYVVGYYAMDQNGYGTSTEFYTWVPQIYGHCSFIVFAYQDNTQITVEDTDTGVNIATFTLNKGDHWQIETLDKRWLHITANNPVSALTCYDQGYFVPSASGKWSGTKFYTYVSDIASWSEDLTVIAYSDGTSVTIKDSDTSTVIWSGTLNSGQAHVESYPNGADKFFAITSSKPVTVSIQPWVSQTGSYHQGAYVADGTGTVIGTDLIGSTLNAGYLYILAYRDNTNVVIYNSQTGELIKTYTLDEGDYIEANPGNGLWRIMSNYPVSAYSGWGYWNADFAPVEFREVTAVNVNIFTDKFYAPGEDITISAKVTDADRNPLYPLEKKNFKASVNGNKVDIVDFKRISCTDYRLKIKAPHISGTYTITITATAANGQGSDSTEIKVFTIGNVLLTVEGNRLTKYDNSADTPIYYRGDSNIYPIFSIDVEVNGATLSEIKDSIQVFATINDYTNVKDSVSKPASYDSGISKYKADWKNSPNDYPVGKYDVTAEVKDLGGNLLASSEKKYFYLIFKPPANKEDFLTKGSTCGLVKVDGNFRWQQPYSLHQYDHRIWKPALEKITGEISISGDDNAADKLTTFAYKIGDYGHCYPKTKTEKKTAWFEDSLIFLEEKPSDIKCTDGTKKRRSGVCIDFAMLGISYFTSVGIPTRPVSGWYLNPVKDVGHSYAEIYDESSRYDNWQDYWNHSDPGWNKFGEPNASASAGFQWDPLETKRDSLDCNSANEDRRQYYNYFATITNNKILDKDSYDYGDIVGFTVDVTNTGMLDIVRPLYMRASLTPTLPLICGRSQTDTLKICDSLNIEDQAHGSIGLHLPDNGNIRNQLCKKIAHWDYRTEVYFKGAYSKDVILDKKEGDVPGMCGSFEPSLIIDNVSTAQLGIMNSTEVTYNNITNESTYRFILSDNLTTNIEHKIKYKEHYAREIWNILNSDYDKKHTYALITPLLGFGDSVYIPGYGSITANQTVDIDVDYIVIYNTTVGTNGSINIYAFSNNMTLKDVTLFNGVVKVIGMQNCTLASESGESYLTYLSTRNGCGMSFNEIYNNFAQEIVGNEDTLTQFFIEGEHELISYYKVGDTVYVNTSISNNGVLAETKNLSLTITEPDPYGAEDIIYNTTKEVIIPAKSKANITFQYQIPDNPYIGKHGIIVSDGITKATTIFMIQTPFNVTFDVPATVTQAEEFYVNATISNALAISLSGINVTIELPNDFNTSENLTKNIGTLLSGESADVSWLVNATDFEYGYAPITLYINSAEGIDDIAITSLTVLRLPELKIFPSAPPEVQISAPFDFKVNVTNEGDLNLSGVSVNLSLPDNVTTTDNLTKFIGDLAGGETKLVNWTITSMCENNFWITVNGWDLTGTYSAQATELINIVKPEIEVNLVNPVEVILNQNFSATAKIKNIGELNATSVKVNLSLPSEFETVNDTFVNIGNLSQGETKDVEWILKGVKAGYGEITVNVTLSGAFSITKGVIVTHFPLTVKTNKETYLEGEEVIITTALTNNNPKISYVDLVVNITVQGADFSETYSLPIDYISSLESRNFALTWNSTGENHGDYLVTARVLESSKVLNETSKSFTIAPELNVPLYVGWNMLSLPLKPANLSASAVLPTIPNAGGIAYLWNASNGTYNAISGNMKLELGKAYMISIASNGTWTPTGTEEHGVRVNLTPGWNMIGVPSRANVSTTDITITVGVNTYNLVDAAENGYIGGVFYAWNAADENYEATVISDSAVLKPGIGYFANVIQECTITYP